MLNDLEICIVSSNLPRHDTTASNLRVYEIVKLMETFGVHVVFYSDDVNKYKYFLGCLLLFIFSGALRFVEGVQCIIEGKRSGARIVEKDRKKATNVHHNLPLVSFFDLKYIKAFGKTVNICRFPFTVRSLAENISRNSFDVLWITEVWSVAKMNQMLQLVLLLRKKKPNLKIVLDTMDFHAKFYLRKYQISNNLEDLNTANNFFAEEQKLYPKVDCLVTVSSEESKNIREKIPDSAPLMEIGIINRIKTTQNFNPFISRKNIVFVGHYRSGLHNVDAVGWFLKEVFSLIREKMPDVELHLVGSGAEALPSEFLTQAGVKAIGYVEDLEAALLQYRIMILPLIYGAGMKGKLGSAASVGLPVVTTQIGAEGYPVTHGEDVLIANTPVAFADACLDLYENEALWNRLSVGSRKMIQNHCSLGQAGKAVSAVLQQVMESGLVP